jgi:hypothetical protein
MEIIWFPYIDYINIMLRNNKGFLAAVSRHR